MAHYGMTVLVSGTFTDVAARVKDALKTQGFGTLTEIDVQQSMREKLGQAIEPYVIYGACNPQLALQALTIDREIGLLLPCNVVVRQTDMGVLVSILDPEQMVVLTDETVLHQLIPLMQEARHRLQQVLQELATP